MRTFTQWLLEVTDTENFKRWFGNSAVVDEHGRPLVVYKAMYPYEYDHPDEPEITSINRPGMFPAFHRDDPGIKIAGFFGDQPTANRFAFGISRQSSIFPVYLSIQKPYVVDAKGDKAGNIQFGASGQPFRDAMRSGMYDGAIIKNTEDEGTIYVALHPWQIKSALSNRTFDPNNHNITQ